MTASERFMRHHYGAKGYVKPEEPKFVPNYRIHCIVCGQTPTVDILPIGGKPKHHTDMCGVCTWGEAECADPENWK